MTKAIYAFSGDPITYGHIDIISRAARHFENVVVGIGVNPSKNYTFTLEERTEMAKRSLATLPNVSVVSFEGLLVDYAYKNGIQVIVKGVRTPADYDYENMLHQLGDTQKLGIETFLLFAKPQLAHISSSAVKAMQKEYGMIHEFVPLNVKQQVEARLSGQYIVGITGEPGTGKSYVGKKFEEYGKSKGIEVHNIELDHIGHKVLEASACYENVRRQIAEVFGKEVQREDGSIDRKVLGDIVFNDPTKLAMLNSIMYLPLLTGLRDELRGKKGLILVNAALIAEAGLGHLCNNNVLLVYADKSVQKQRLEARGLDAAQIQRRLESQYSFEKKLEVVADAAKKEGHGSFKVVNNSGDSDEEGLKSMFKQIVSDMKVKKS